MEFLARSEDADLQSEEGRQIPGRRAVLLQGRQVLVRALRGQGLHEQGKGVLRFDRVDRRERSRRRRDRKSTRLNSSHVETSYAVFCLKKKTTKANVIIAVIYGEDGMLSDERRHRD